MEGLREGLVLALLALPLVGWASALYARRVRWGQHIRPEGPAEHKTKEGTPTMGGLIVLAWTALGTAILAVLRGSLPWTWGFVLASTAAGAVVGLVDDLRSQRRRASVGFFPHQTLLVQILLGVLLCLVVPRMGNLELRIPFWPDSLPLGSIPSWGWIPLVVVGFVGTVNAVNLTDGLDGLASGSWVIAVLGLLPVLISSSLAGLALVAAGATLGFLWANAHPASVILGNVGSMGLGGLLFGLAMASGGIFLLPLVGGVFVVEALSVMIQVGSYKLRQRRVFKMAPLHHHLEQGSVPWTHDFPSPHWPEPKVVVRLWLVGGGFALLGALAALPGLTG